MVALAVWVLAGAVSAAEVFTVATYNLENYIDHVTRGRPIKSPESRAQIRKILLSFRPDVLAVQEIGLKSALLELRDSLRKEGLDYPYWEHVGGWDTNIYVGVLSRFPIVERHSVSREFYLLHGKRFQISRGFAEVVIQVNPHYRFTLLTAHLKSRRPVPWADQAEMREEEARLLREKVDAILHRHPNANLVLLGDMNDTKDSRTLRILLGRGRYQLVDTRPAEQNGDLPIRINPRYDPRTITWTHFYGKSDTYERVDYILLSPGMAREWIRQRTRVVTYPNWGLASDHRPIVAAFWAEDR